MGGHPATASIPAARADGAPHRPSWLQVDQGRTWSTPGPTGLPNPDSKTHVIRLRGSNDLAIAFNDHQKYHEDGFTRFRTRLRVAISRDDGKTCADRV